MFEPGDRVVVVKKRPFLHHDIGEIATVVKYIYRKSDPLVEVEWDKGEQIRSHVFADQFVKMIVINTAKVEDTREYLSIITGETNV